MYESHKICFEEKYMGTSFVYDMIYFVLFFSNSCIFMARTFSGKPKSVIKPSAS